MKRTRWPKRPIIARAARVAIISTLVIAVVAVAASIALDSFIDRRITWEVDQRLSDRLLVVAHLSNPITARSLPDDLGTDGAPVYLWWVPAHGHVISLTNGGPAAPIRHRDDAAGLGSITEHSTVYRVDAVDFRGGLLVAAQDLAGPLHVGRTLEDGELVLGPVLLLAVFLGILVIGVQAAGPVEAARKHLLEFTADASHELRTPLTVINAEIELASGGGEDPATALSHVARESRRLGKIVEDLLWLARVDAEPGPPVREPVDLVSVAAACVDRFAPVAASRGLTLELRDGNGHVGSTTDAWVEGADTWFDRLFGTLLDNSLRYSPPSSCVYLGIRSEGSRVSLVVEDGGPGIPKDEADRLFDRFHRASDHPDGAGLGLAIADSVVRGTGGRWRIGTSSLGGACFEVSWRRASPPLP